MAFLMSGISYRQRKEVTLNRLPETGTSFGFNPWDK